jgi:hypothetical protein
VDFAKVRTGLEVFRVEEIVDVPLAEGGKAAFIRLEVIRRITGGRYLVKAYRAYSARVQPSYPMDEGGAPTARQEDVSVRMEYVLPRAEYDTPEEALNSALALLATLFQAPTH